ncbi:sel1 repeat family protein [Herbaspirillum sp. HC18]|nr:sel1 repeat family protein [Herbaspirillum sp. HC18]
MATREEIAVLYAARAGQAHAQLLIGKHYLFGGNGLTCNATTALYWLDRAAHQGESEAWMLIGKHIPFEIAQRARNPLPLCTWYERAFEHGITHAGVVFAQLILSPPGDRPPPLLREKALSTLTCAATAGNADAQWMLAQLLGLKGSALTHRVPAGGNKTSMPAVPALRLRTALEWATRAAQNGIVAAQYLVAMAAWNACDEIGFLRWALPIASAIAASNPDIDACQRLSSDDRSLLVRCATSLSHSANADHDLINQFLDIAATAGERDAQFALGLRLANLDSEGNRLARTGRHSDYKMAIRWLTMAGEQGIAAAWYVLSTLYRRPNASIFLQPQIESRRCLERAALNWHVRAQLEMGLHAWRTRRGSNSNDVRAVYWLQRAATQGCAEATDWLGKIATRATPATWAQAAQRTLTADMCSTYPFLAARIQLAATFGLSCAEALLIDLNAADRRHCLVVDITAHHKRSKRRLILIETGKERQALTCIVRLFENIDCGPGGPEGNYHKRRSLFNRVIGQSAALGQ